MGYSRLVLAIIIAATLLGCAPIIWHLPPGVDQQQFLADDAACRLEATEQAQANAPLSLGWYQRTIYKLCMKSKGYTEEMK